MPDQINHPSHYGGADSPYEAIKVIEAWGLGFALGNALKYICRAGRKRRSRGAEPPGLEDLKKARWYLDREISQLEAQLCQQQSSKPLSPVRQYSELLKAPQGHSGTAPQEKSTGQAKGSASEKPESGSERREEPSHIEQNRSTTLARLSEPTWRDGMSQEE